MRAAMEKIWRWLDRANLDHPGWWIALVLAMFPLLMIVSCLGL